MTQPKLRYPETASQTGGPYVHIGLAPQQAGFEIFENTFGNVLVSPQTQGERIRIEGRVFDGTGTAVRDVLIELWQANAAGRYAHPGDLQGSKALDPHFRGWGRTGADFETGLYHFQTIKPGAVAGRNGSTQAPHVTLWIVARGINIGLHTRMYFSDEAAANAADPVLRLVDPARQDTLIAPRTDRRDACPLYTFDIHLQGERETVFFDL